MLRYRSSHLIIFDHLGLSQGGLSVQFCLHLGSTHILFSRIKGGLLTSPVPDLVALSFLASTLSLIFFNNERLLYFVCWRT